MEKKMKQVKYNLEDRLIDFAVMVIDAAEQIPDTRAGNHIGGQLIRSGTSPAPNYGEAQGAESRNDFIHKMKVAFKELRETRVWLRIVLRKAFVIDRKGVELILDECEQLIRIFGKAIATADSKHARTGLRSQDESR
jgi:four helix bundle protein